jgi:hypothetical protein
MGRKAAKPTLHVADGIWGSPAHLEGVFLTLTLGQHPLKIWVFIASVTNEFILGLDILRSYDASMDLGHQMFHLAEEEVLLWSPSLAAR